MSNLYMSSLAKQEDSSPKIISFYLAAYISYIKSSWTEKALHAVDSAEYPEKKLSFDKMAYACTLSQEWYW